MPTNSDIDKILLRFRYRRPSASSTASSTSSRDSSSSSNGGSSLATASSDDESLVQSLLLRTPLDEAAIDGNSRKRSADPASTEVEQPLDLTSTRSKKRRLHHMCGAKNCCRQNGSVYTDVLLRPELLKTVKGGKESSSSNPLLEFILDGGVGDKKPQPPLQPPHYSSAFSSLRFSSSATESSEKPTKRSKEDESALQLSLLLNPLLRICSKTPFGKEESEELRAILGVKDGTNNKLIGCDNKQIHATGPNGRTAMHFLISGCTRETFPHVLDSIYQLLGFGFDLRKTDDTNNDTALTAVRALLDRRLYHEAHLLTLLFLQAGHSVTDINHVNAQGRTLLSHAVEHGDATIHTSRLIINHGALVWPNEAEDGITSSSIVDRLALERERSAFTWFLRSVMEDGSGGLAGRAETLSLLSHAMGDDPVRMQSHVMRVMMHLGHSRLALGPLFNEVRAKMAPFWTRPQRLGYLCLRQVRKSIGPKKLSEDRLLLETLNIPNTMLGYLQLA